MDQWTVSLMHPGRGSTGMIKVPRGESARSYAERLMNENEQLVSVSFYRNGRFVGRAERDGDQVRSWLTHGWQE